MKPGYGVLLILGIFSQLEAAEPYILLSLDGKEDVRLAAGAQVTRTIYAVPPGTDFKLTVALPKSFSRGEETAQLTYLLFPSGGRQTLRFDKSGETETGVAFSGSVRLEAASSLQQLSLESVALIKTELKKGWWNPEELQAMQPLEIGCGALECTLDSLDGRIHLVTTHHRFDDGGIKINVPSTLEEITRTFSVPETSLGARAIEIWSHPAVGGSARITDAGGSFSLVPVIEEARLLWDGVETHIDRTQNRAVKGGAAPLKVKFRLSSPVPAVRPAKVRLTLFRPDANGEILEGTRRAELSERELSAAADPSLDWGDFEWTVGDDDFNRGGSGFRDGTYRLDIQVTTFDDAVETERTFFRVMGEPPVVEISKSAQRGTEGTELTLTTAKPGSRFDLSAAANESGPFVLLTRDVMDSPPPSAPWEPFLEIFSPWELMRSGSQSHWLAFGKIKEALALRTLPAVIYLRLRAVDEAGNGFVGKPFKLTIGKTDSWPPEISLGGDGNVIRITDLGKAPALGGTVSDRSGGDGRPVWIYLDKEGVNLSSAAVSLRDNEAGSWFLTIPEAARSRLNNGRHEATITAIDAAGNSTLLPVTLDVEISEFNLVVPNPLYTRSGWEEAGGTKRAFLNFRAEAKENSMLSLKVDGNIWAEGFFTGGRKSVETAFFSDKPLSQGKHGGSAALVRDGVKKSVQFDLIVDNTPPQAGGLRSDTGRQFKDASQTFLNISADPALSLEAGVENEPVGGSPVHFKYALASSENELERLFNQNGAEHSPDGSFSIELSPDKTHYLGLLAEDEAGNRSSLHIYPLYRDAQPPAIGIASVDQKSYDLKSFDRQNLWISLAAGETTPQAARADVAVSLAPEGPWQLISPSVVENAPPDSPWIWNDTLGEEEWLSVRKQGENSIPFNFALSRIKSALGISEFPGSGGSVTLYIRLRSKDIAGNEFTAAPFAAPLQVDRRAPSISLDKEEFHIVDFDGEGSVISGSLTDDPAEPDSPLLISLYKEDSLIAQSQTSRRYGGRFEISLPESAAGLLPNGSHTLRLVAEDVDGNRREEEVKVRLDVKPLAVASGDKIYARNVPGSSPGRRALALDLDVVPNSLLSLRADGEDLIQRYPVGPVQKIAKAFDVPHALTGEIRAALKFHKNGRSASRIITLVIDDDPPRFLEFTDAERSLEFHEPGHLADQSWNYPAAANFALQVKLTDAASLRYAAGSDPAELSRRMERGDAAPALPLPEPGNFSADIVLVPNRPTYLLWEAEGHAGLKSQTLLPFLFDAEPPALTVVSSEQKSPDERSFDRNFLWLRLKNSESEPSWPRFDAAFARDAAGPWHLITRDVINSPPPRSPWQWKSGSGAAWRNFTASPDDLLSFPVSLAEVRNLLGGKGESGNGRERLYVRLRAVDYAGNAFTGEPHLLELERDDNAPELIVEGAPGPIRLYDLNRFGGLSGSVRDKPYAPDNFTQIFLRKGEVVIATAALRTDSEIFSRWDIVVPESARPLLGAGEQEVQIAALDSDGNETVQNLKVDVDVASFGIEVEDPLHMRSDLVYDRSKKSSFHLRAKVKENSTLSLYVDGALWAAGLNNGSKREIDERIESNRSLAEGEHTAEVVLKRDGEKITRKFGVIVDNHAPRILAVKEEKSGASLLSGSRNVLGDTAPSLLFKTDEPHLKAARYALSGDAADLPLLLASGIPFEEKVALSLVAGATTVLGVELEDRAGSITRDYYFLEVNPDKPRTTFGKNICLLDAPEKTGKEEALSSGRLALAYQGESTLVLSGTLRREDAPGKVELVGLRGSFQSQSDAAGRWQILLPSHALPLAEESDLFLQVTGANLSVSVFPLRIMRQAKAGGITLDERVPLYVTSRTLTLAGTVRSLAPLEQFTAQIKPEGVKLILVREGEISASGDSEYDPKTGRFRLRFSNLRESGMEPRTLEIAARTLDGRDLFYAQPARQDSLPSFFVDFTPPAAPTIKVSWRSEESALLEGEADGDGASRILLINAAGILLSQAQVYAANSEDFSGKAGQRGAWNRKLENLPPGDYELFAQAEDAAGNRSAKTGPAKFTIYKKSGARVRLDDFSKGRGTYAENSRPLISGRAGAPRVQVQIFETGNYVGSALSDSDGNFSFTPGEDLRNGWKNFTAVVQGANGERSESELLRVYLSVDGAPLEERLIVKPEPKSVLERETVSFLVTTKEGVGMAGARVILLDQEKETNAKGRAQMFSPSLKGSAALTVPVRAEVTLPNGVKLAGSSRLEVVAGDAWDIRFSPNGDGINDEVLFDPGETPVRIMQWRREEVVKEVTAADGCRWDGRKSDGRACEQSLYLARTRTGRKLVISLYR